MLVVAHARIHGVERAGYRCRSCYVRLIQVGELPLQVMLVLVNTHVIGLDMQMNDTACEYVHRFSNVCILRIDDQEI